MKKSLCWLTFCSISISEHFFLRWLLIKSDRPIKFWTTLLISHIACSNFHGQRSLHVIRGSSCFECCVVVPYMEKLIYVNEMAMSFCSPSLWRPFKVRVNKNIETIFRNKFSFESYSKKPRANQMARIALFTCEKNDTFNQKPLFMSFTCEPYHGDQNLTTICIRIESNV